MVVPRDTNGTYTGQVRDIEGTHGTKTGQGRLGDGTGTGQGRSLTLTMVVVIETINREIMNIDIRARAREAGQGRRTKGEHPHRLRASSTGDTGTPLLKFLTAQFFDSFISDDDLPFLIQSAEGFEKE